MGLGEGGEDAAWGYAVLVAELLCLCVCFCFLFFFFCEGVWFCGEEGIGVGLEAVFVNSCFGLFFFFLIVKKTKRTTLLNLLST